MARPFNRKTIRRLTSVLSLLLLLTLPAGAAEATDVRADVRAEARAVISESLQALWTDREFEPGLKKRQQALRDMLVQSVISRSELEDMITRAAFPIMSRTKTTRYILKKMPERVNALFSPHLQWEEVRKCLWQAAIAMIGNDRQGVMTVATLAPAGTPWLAVPEKLIAELEQLTNGRYTAKIFGSGVMGEDTEILRKMATGQLDGCGCSVLGILTASPETSIFFLPGLFRNYEEVDYILEKFRKRIDRAFEEKGYILASLFDTGNFHIFSKNKITGLEDIRKGRMLTSQGIVEATLFDELGINAMPVLMTEVISALSTGMAETTVAPAAWMLGMQAYEHVEYFVREPLFYSPAAVIVSIAARERLRQHLELSEVSVHNIQELLVFEFSSMENELKKQARRYEERCLEAFVTRVGMKAVSLPPEDRKVLEQAGRNVWTRLADRAYPGDLLKDILDALDAYRNQSGSTP